MKNSNTTSSQVSGARWSAKMVLATAVALVVTLSIDPFALGSVAPVFANGQSTLSLEDRESEFDDFAEGLQDAGPTESSALVGDEPSEPTSEPLVSISEPVLPEEDEQLVVLTEPDTSGALASTSILSQSTTPPPSGPVEATVGGVDIVVDTVEDAPTPDAVLVRTAGDAETEAAGIEGILLEVADASETAMADAEVELTVAYENFAGLGGAEWASRLQFVWIPDCADAIDDCGPEVLPTVNDTESQTVTAVVPVLSGDSVESAALASSSSVTLASSASASGSLAVTAGPSGPQGNWGATNLSPSGTWGNSGNTGSFTWSMPLNVPSPAAGPSPELAISYSSAASDGRLPTTNNQTGPIGEGFDLPMAYIERTYTPCIDDEGSGANNNDRPSGDLCWGKSNATMSFNGGASELIRESASSNIWYSKFDDGTKVEHLTGAFNNTGERDEYWKVTTTDGTEYYFGRGGVAEGAPDLKSAWTVPVYGNHSGEPCHSSAFKDSRCNQVYRWNLDYVIDPAGNTMTYHYGTEVNRYVFDIWGSGTREQSNQTITAPYTAGGWLERISYGKHSTDSTSQQAPAVIDFTYGTRCITNEQVSNSFCSSNATTSEHHWPDTPTDLICTESTNEECSYSPTFYTTKRLTSITTKTFDGSSFQPVSSWAFRQTYRPQGEGSSIKYALNPMLVLESITETGHGGTAVETDDITRPSIDFRYEFLANRVAADDDGQLPMVRPRVMSLTTETGAKITVTYGTDCGPNDTPGTSESLMRDNGRLCYPVKWYPDASEDEKIEYFHKYVVNSITEAPTAVTSNGEELKTGSPVVVTNFEYEGDAFWEKPTSALVKPKEVTYSEFRGFGAVVTTVGTGGQERSSRTEYYRGTGDTLSAGPTGHLIENLDRERFQGQVFAATELNGSVPVSQVITVPGSPITLAGSGRNSASRIPSMTTTGYAFNAAGDLEFRTSTTTASNQYGQVVTVDDKGDLTTNSDDICTAVSYAHEGSASYAAALLADYQVSLVETTTVTGGACSASSLELISRDSVEYNAAGQVLKSFRANPSEPAANQLVKEILEYDNRGRPTRVKDAAGVESTMTYTHSTGGLLAGMTSTVIDGVSGETDLTTTTTFNPLTGMVLETRDASGLSTTGSYDSLGRLVSVQFPQHEGAPLPSIEYEYTTAKTGLNSVTTRTLAADGESQHVSVAHYDGLLRPFQYQGEGVNTGSARNFDATERGRMVVRILYDSTGRTTSQSNPQHFAGAPSSTPITVGIPTSETRLQYDAAGRPIAEIFFTGNSSESTNEQWRTVTHYDGARTLVIPPTGGTPQMAIMDARGRTIELRQFIRDADTHAFIDTAAEILDPVTGLDFQSTTYAFDRAGQMVAMADTENNQWQYTFDLAGRQTSATDPDGGTTLTTYDAANRVHTRTNGNGDVLAYEYDTLGRTIALHDDNLSGPIRASWEYDTALLPDGEPAIGALASSTRYDGVDAYTTRVDQYDTAYRPLSTTFSLPSTDLFEQALASRDFTTTYAYTADGQVEELALPAIADGNGTTVLGAERITTEYDTASLPEWMSGGFGWGTYVASSRFAADGRLVALDLGNTYAARVGYDYNQETKRLAGIVLHRQRHGSEFDLRYEYDDAGNVLSIMDDSATTPATQDNQCFGYDGLQRLTLAWTPSASDCSLQQGSITEAAVGGISPYWTEYSYDPLGNRDLMVQRELGTNPTKTTTYVHGIGGAGPHQLTSVTESVAGGSSSTTQFTYDEAGNRDSASSGGVTQGYNWDAEGELTSTDGELTSTDGEMYKYDASGNRMLRQSDAGLTVYLPGGQELFIQGAAGSTELSATRYYSFAGRMVAMRTGAGLSGVTSFVGDHQGTLIAAVPNTNWAANAVERIYTDPFGGTRAGSDPLPGDRGFLGAVEDSTGLTLLGARYYDPHVGSFISVDPLLSPGVPAQFNAYVYSGNNPVTWSDPTGLFWNNLVAGFQSIVKKAGNVLKTAWNATVSFVDKYKAEIVGGIVGFAVGLGCTVATGGAGVVACAIAGGAAGAAVTNVMKQAESGKPFDVGSFVFDTAVGGALGLIGGAAGPLLSSAIRSVTSSGAPAAALSAVRNAISNTLNRAPSFRPAAAPVRPPAAPGGGAVRPAGAIDDARPTSARAPHCSFGAATLVLMADGSSKPISEITAGDSVISSDAETGEQIATVVDAVLVHEDVIVDLVIDGEAIVTTEDHPFWSILDNDFVRADSLKAGDLLLSSDGTVREVHGIASDSARVALAYNLDVLDINTYHVGASELLVHNADSCELDLDGIAHASERHTWGGGLLDETASVFDSGVDLSRIASASHGQVGVRNSVSGNIEYRVTFDDIIGVTNRSASNPQGSVTNMVRYIRDQYDGALLTMHPVR